MKKGIGKKILVGVGCFLLVVLLVLLLLPVWIGWVVKPVANSVVSDVTGANFHLGEFALNPYSGVLHVGDMQLSNPTNGGFRVEENCVELGTLDVDVEVSSVCGKKIVIPSIELDGLTIRTTPAGGNFLQIAANASGEPAPEAEGEASEEGAENEAEEEAEEIAEETHVEIDKLVLKNIKIVYGNIPLPFPTITIEGIGADSEEGATLEDAGKTIYEKVMAAGGAIGGQLGDLGKGAAGLLGDGAGAALDGASSALDALGAGKATDAIGEGASKAADAIGDGAGKAVDAISDFFKKGK